VSDLSGELLRAVCARPHEDEPRLVYADWLLEQGDLRGRFIADQVALARLPESDPRWSALYARTERLRHRHGGPWLEALDLQHPRVRATFCRGFVERLVGEADSSLLRSLPGRTPLRFVQLPLSAQMMALATGLALGLICVLSRDRPILSPWLAEQPAEALSQVVRLDMLLPHAGLTDLSLEDSPLRRLPSLRELRLDEGNPWRSPDYTPWIETGQFDALEVLELRGHGQSTPFLPALFARRSSLPVRLVLEQYALLPPAVARALRSWRPLRALALSGLQDHETCAFLQDEVVQEHLEHLTMARTLVQSELPGLRSGQWARLTRLRCSSGGSDLLQALARAPVLPQLVELSAPTADDRSVMTLISSPHPPRLVTLSVGELRNRTVVALAGWPGLAHVTSLSFARTEPFNQVTFKALLQSPYLDPVQLELRGQKLAPPQLDELRERFPGALSQR
jgi:uncharacterized protein (TIGR02996 family)